MIRAMLFSLIPIITPCVVQAADAPVYLLAGTVANSAAQGSFGYSCSEDAGTAMFKRAAPTPTDKFPPLQITLPGATVTDETGKTKYAYVGLATMTFQNAGRGGIEFDYDKENRRKAPASEAAVVKEYKEDWDGSRNLLTIRFTILLYNGCELPILALFRG